jgi:hypothetical protein
LSKLQEGLDLVLDGYMETCRFKRCSELLSQNLEGEKCQMHGTKENPVYIMLNILKLNCGVKFILKTNGYIVVSRYILRRLQIIGTRNQ